MAGTDTSAPPVLGGPVVILVRPQLGQNIGATARAMLNFGLTEMRLVAPRDGWPNPEAEAMASRADQVLEAARVFPTTAEAVADLRLVLATTARPRDMRKPVMTPREAAAALREAAGRDAPAGLLFGGERAGLDNDDIVRADAVIAVPANPAFASLNLAQAVLLLGYEWYQAGPAIVREKPGAPPSPAATRAELENFFTRLEAGLDSARFLRPPEKRPSMVRNIRNIFQRADLSEQEVRTLHGIVSALMRQDETPDG